MKKQKIMLLVNDTTYAYNLRKEVIEKLVAEGHEVVVVCALLLLQEELKALGCRLIGVETGRQGTNPVEDLKLFAQYMQMTPAMIFDYMGILMDKKAMADQDFTINVTLSDLKQQHVLHVKNGVLLVYENTRRDAADVSITCPKNALLYILQSNVHALDGVPMEGKVELITLLAQSMNQVPVQGTVPFNIIEP